MTEQAAGRDRPPKRRPFSSQGWLAPGLGFYAAMAGLAWLWRDYAQAESVFFLSPADAARGVAVGRDLGLGLLAGGCVVGLSALATHFTRFGRRLADRMGEILAGLPLWQALLLAILSAGGEELFFRGALQPNVGWLAASLLFGLMHIGPGRDYVPWTVFAILVGGLLGWLFIATGNLLAPIVAHAVVNGINLPLLSRRFGSRPPAGSWAADDPQARGGDSPSA